MGWRQGQLPCYSWGRCKGAHGYELVSAFPPAALFVSDLPFGMKMSVLKEETLRRAQASLPTIEF